MNFQKPICNGTLNSGSGVFDINSSGQLSIKTNLTGSTTASGDQ